ncbi:MAG: phage tail sheath C-terminal domain-containing protein [Bacteroidota bacterium]
MPSTYKTPGVYVEEISIFPPSVASVETAVPAFIGYTEKADKGGESLSMKPTRIRSLVEYKEWFGGPPPAAVKVYLDENDQVGEVLPEDQFYMYDALRMFFNNGGGKCYIISVGSYRDAVSKTALLDGLTALEKEDEPTIILSPDATLLNVSTPGSVDLYDFQKAALAQCNKLQDRVVICDLKKEVPGDNSDLFAKVDEFRSNVGINYLKYGAAYTPWLKTTLPRQINFRDISLKRGDSSASTDLKLKDLSSDTQIASIIDAVEAAKNVVNDLESSASSLGGSASSLNGRFKQLFAAFTTAADAWDPGDAAQDAAVFAPEIPDLFNLLIDCIAAVADALALSGASVLKLESVLDTSELDALLQILVRHHSALNFASMTKVVPLDTSNPNFAKAIKFVNSSYNAIGDIPSDPAVTALYAAISAAPVGTLTARASQAANAESNAADAKTAGAAAMGDISAANIKTSFNTLIDSLPATNTATDLATAAATASSTADGGGGSTASKALAALVSSIANELKNSNPSLVIGTSADTPVHDAVSTHVNEAVSMASKIASRSTNSTGSSKANVVSDIGLADFGNWAKAGRDAVFAGYTTVTSFYGSAMNAASAAEATYDSTLENAFGFYKNLKAKIGGEINVLPPSSTVAGVYAAVDSNRGVWKAPANVSLTTVLAPTTQISHEEQGDLNVDVNAGKSINAIRSFAGKGVLIWGARTLAGNDNEWRYVSVRRFYNMVEESVKKATEQFVFEPNDANTWVKLKGMIENYLTILWRQGALAGAKTNDAFFVKVGLGETMSAQDILEGRLNVEIGMAVVRPAEFIILKFSHKMQES